MVRRVIQVGGRVDPIDLDARLGDEARLPLGGALERRLKAISLPSVLVLIPALRVAQG
jgi:hypothetical protein